LSNQERQEPSSSGGETARDDDHRNEQRGPGEHRGEHTERVG
jgi:hypothetical protein